MKGIAAMLDALKTGMRDGGRKLSHRKGTPTMKILLFSAAALLIAVPASFAAPPKTVDPAPLFEAPSTAGAVRLADYRGRKPVVLAFYYADFTPG